MQHSMQACHLYVSYCLAVYAAMNEAEGKGLWVKMGLPLGGDDEKWDVGTREGICIRIEDM